MQYILWNHKVLGAFQVLEAILYELISDLVLGVVQDNYTTVSLEQNLKCNITGQNDWDFSLFKIFQIYLHIPDKLWVISNYTHF